MDRVIEKPFKNNHCATCEFECYGKCTKKKKSCKDVKKCSDYKEYNFLR